MISLRLPPELEEKLAEISTIEKRTKTDIIKESLLLYIKERESAVSPYELGKKFFGKYRSGKSDTSVEHRKTIRDKIKKKHNV